MKILYEKNNSFIAVDDDQHFVFGAVKPDGTYKVTNSFMFLHTCLSFAVTKLSGKEAKTLETYADKLTAVWEDVKKSIDAFKA